MTEFADCRCETILSPQMEYKPGPHHDADCPMRRPPLDEGKLVDTGSFFVRVDES
jgi:hypothetical protein